MTRNGLGPHPWRISLLAAVIGGGMVLAQYYRAPLGGSDFDQIWWAARALLRGDDPYLAIGPGMAIRFQFPLYYPLTTVLFGIPLATLDFHVARLVFVAGTAGILGYAIGRTRPYLWPLFFGIPFFSAVRSAQWSPLFTAALLLPALGWVACAKPNLGIALLAGARDRRSALIIVGGSVVLFALSWVLWPSWPREWLHALADAPHFRPLMLRPGGIVMLLALVQWRDPDARMLLALAAVPQTGLFYDALPAALVARSRLEAILLALVTQFGWLLGQTFGYTYQSFAEQTWSNGIYVLWSAMFPALVMVLRRGWLERQVPRPADAPLDTELQVKNR